ncbi:hypothetical protein EJ08DRAFT_668033 [Tothia fuscella]|uniref:Calcineurin-like phosphoesterase domain-containing protein n=1 Tax=Tothia fuscella TaxID=1048955 RepID=A0A9P4U3J7_9PEZI|nr:hypothetical protein EJ08DRAFT_668033 [Tothia fuscella]
MAYFPPQFQIVSDLHLETPLLRPSYSKYTQEIEARHLCLLGDIGLVKDDGLFHFLETLLKKTPNLIILYVLGNHESYQMTLAAGKQKLRDFEEKITKEYPGSPRFVFLDRKRCDINNRVSVLGCTLWSRILPEQMQRVSTALTDFNERNGIREWTPSDHLEEHRKDLAWLNDQVQRIEKEEPERQIVIFTHHSPTVDSRANNPRHVGSPFSSGFVKLWAVGHTHFSCDYREEGSGKLVVANQKGYSRIGDVGREEGQRSEAASGRGSSLDKRSQVTQRKGHKRILGWLRR